MPQNQPIVYQLLVAASPVATVLLIWLFAELVRFTRTHVKNASLQAAFVRLENVTKTVVLNIAQTEGAELKAKAADGKLSPEDAKALKDKAVSMVKDYLGSQGVEDLKKVVEPDKVQAFIESKIEAAVKENGS